MGTAYAALMFLAFCLWLGPWNVLRQRPNPISFDLRRDAGIWTGMLATLHSAIGLTVHLRGRTWMYFFKRLHPVQLQTTQFGFANFTGLGAALLFLMLMAISNDVSLRAMKTKRWKNLQRWTYVAFGLTWAHGIAYQMVEKRHATWVVIFSGAGIGVVIGQSLGFFQIYWRNRQENGLRGDHIRTGNDIGLEDPIKRGSR